MMPGPGVPRSIDDAQVPGKGGQAVATVWADQDVIFDADADLARAVQPRLDRDHHSGLLGLRVGAHDLGGFVDFAAQPVPGLVQDQVLERRRRQDIRCRLVDRTDRGADLDRVASGCIRLQHGLVDRRMRIACMPAKDGSGDVGMLSP